MFKAQLQRTSGSHCPVLSHTFETGLGANMVFPRLSPSSFIRFSLVGTGIEAGGNDCYGIPSQPEKKESIQSHSLVSLQCLRSKKPAAQSQDLILSKRVLPCHFNNDTDSLTIL